jgi:hypothetical protein
MQILIRPGKMLDKKFKWRLPGSSNKYRSHLRLYEERGLFKDDRKCARMNSLI